MSKLVKIIFQRILIVCMCLGFTGCIFTQPKPNDPAYAPVPPDKLIPPQKRTGGIYQEGYGLSLFEDTTARQIGDIITIVLTEKTSSKKSNETKVTKKDEIDMKDPTILGTSVKFKTPGYFPLINRNNNNLKTTVDMEREFEGKGTNDTSNELSGQITVTVAQVLPNRNLIVRGEKWMTFGTSGSEYIRLTGIVRPEDIGSDNTVSSTRVADVRISYSGDGSVADAGKMGWLSRFFVSTIWPF